MKKFDNDLIALIVALVMMTILFVLSKIFVHLTWPWIMVFIPLWIVPALFFAFLVISTTFMFVALLFHCAIQSIRRKRCSK